MKNILTLLAEGAISIDDAERQLKLFAVHELKGMANLDIGRNKRVGKPDVVRAKGKTNEQVMILVAPILDEEGLVIVSGATAEHRTRLNEQYHDIEIDFDSDVQEKEVEVVEKAPAEKAKEAPAEKAKEEVKDE